jgi:hypothetical protein
VRTHDCTVEHVALAVALLGQLIEDALEYVL